MFFPDCCCLRTDTRMVSINSLSTKLNVALRTKQTQPIEGSRRDGVAFIGSGRDGGGVGSLMDWEELAGSCSTPGGK